MTLTDMTAAVDRQASKQSSEDSNSVRALALMLLPNETLVGSTSRACTLDGHCDNRVGLLKRLHHSQFLVCLRAQ